MSSRSCVSLLGVVALSGVASIAAAGGKGRECKPSGSPNQLGQTGAVGVAQPVEYWSKPWLLLTDNATRPDKVRLLSADGKVIDISKPPITVEPMQWLARGRAVYALSKGRSQTAGKNDVVLMRWGTDPRPRQTQMRVAVTLEGQMHAAFANEFLAVSWAEKAGDGTLHRMVSIMDSEQLRVGEPRDLGIADAAAARVQAIDKSFVLLWTSPKGLMRATFDLFGKPTSPIATLTWAAPPKGTPTTLAVVQCGDQSWLVQQDGHELALSFGGASGELKTVARLPVSASDALLPMQCVDDAIAVGRRTQDTKAGNATFWVSTVDHTGKVHDRRVKDTHGTADDIRMPQFSQSGTELTSWWIEGNGAEATVWSRNLICH
jgi:hypothetical protein